MKIKRVIYKELQSWNSKLKIFSEEWGRFGMAALGLLLSLATAYAFNIDTRFDHHQHEILIIIIVAIIVIVIMLVNRSVVVHSGPRETCDSECMFGFAVAQHKEAGVPW